MVPKYTIMAYRAVATPITQPITKFGGQPVWIAPPQWPVSRATAQPMRFICQIMLDERVFGSLAGRMAYIFLTDNDDPKLFAANTWEADGGENAVIIQPGGTTDLLCHPLATGPTLYKYVWDTPRIPGTPGTRVPVELAVDLVSDHDPDNVDAMLTAGQDGAAYPASWDPLSEDKIGGAPAFLQSPEYPLGEDARLLLQLNEPTDSAYSINLGDAGVAYAFISADGSRGKLLWQCA